MASVLNSINGMELGCLVEHAGEASHTTNDSTNGDISNDGIAEFLVELFNLNLSSRNLFSHLVLEGSGEHSAQACLVLCKLRECVHIK